MKNYLIHWNFMRLLRLAMGIFMIVQGFIHSQWMFVLAGGGFSLLPLLNIGSCATGNCAVPVRKKTDKIIFEEAKKK